MTRTQQRLLGLLLLAGATLFIGAWFGAVPLSATVAPPVTPVAMGGGEFVIPQVPELDLVTEAAILTEIRRNQQRLYWEGRLPLPRAGAAVALAFPMRLASGFDDFGYFGISNFVDHDPNYPDSLRDYNNGTRTYDTSGGYNHAGTDYALYPFAWLKMENNAVEVIAAADGVIVSKSDGNYDRNCSFSAAQWNAVYVQHADGTVAWYGHLKTNSLTPKAVGQSVAAGEYLGRVRQFRLIHGAPPALRAAHHQRADQPDDRPLLRRGQPHNRRQPLAQPAALLRFGAVTPGRRRR